MRTIGRIEHGMKVLLVDQFFFPDVAAVAQLMTDLAEDLTEKGIRVSVLCGRANYSREKNDPRATNPYLKQVKVRRMTSLNLRGRSGVVHLLNYLSFLILAPLRAITLSRYDCTVVFTNPPLIALVGWLLKLLRGTKFVYVVEDLYPDVAIELGFLKRDGVVTKIVNKASSFLLRQADRVVVLDDRVKHELVAKEVKKDRIVIIPNWADGKQIYPVEKSANLFVERHNLKGKFVIQYSGRMGEAHDFSTILQAAKRLKEYDDIVFLFIGNGPKRGEITEFKERYNLDNVLLLPYQDRTNLRFSLGAADVSLISLKSNLESLMVPCKVYGIMASGRPFIYLGSDHGEMSRIAQMAECGFTVPPGKVELLFDTILHLYQDESLPQELGSKAREYFLEHFERKLATAQYYGLLMDVVEDGIKD
jgi:glycosyltransferase involved in cell wall biosynthesis